MMKSNAKRILNQILNRTEEEREFLDRFLEKGEYEPELLFEGGQARLLRNHPAVLWKLQNLRKFKGLGWN